MATSPHRDARSRGDPTVISKSHRSVGCRRSAAGVGRTRRNPAAFPSDGRALKREDDLLAPRVGGYVHATRPPFDPGSPGLGARARVVGVVVEGVGAGCPAGIAGGLSHSGGASIVFGVFFKLGITYQDRFRHEKRRPIGRPGRGSVCVTELPCEPPCKGGVGREPARAEPLLLAGAHQGVDVGGVLHQCGGHDQRSPRTLSRAKSRSPRQARRRNPRRRHLCAVGQGRTNVMPQSHRQEGSVSPLRVRSPSRFTTHSCPTPNVLQTSGDGQPVRRR